MKSLQERLADLHEAVKNCPEVYHIIINDGKRGYCLLERDATTLKGRAEVEELDEDSYRKYKVTKRIDEDGEIVYFTDTKPNDMPTIEDAYEEFCAALNKFVEAIDGH